MILRQHVPLHRLILSLSQALDFVHPHVVDHQQRVAYIAIRIGQQMGLRGEAMATLFNAAALHDIGLIGMENRVRALHLGQLESRHCHGMVGASLLQSNPIFAAAAPLVRYHHARYDENAAEEIPMGAFIIALADVVERAIDRNLPVLEQHELIYRQIKSLGGTQLHPECVAAFIDIARAEAFWLDVVSERIYGVLLRQMDWADIFIDEFTLEPIAETFARVVDAASRWTMVHSAGVAATAVELAKRMDFGPREQRLIHAAGLLHDLGKLSVPTEILDKPGKLTPAELAIVRGHTYHTFAILDTIGGMPQISEWAAFHHERLDGAGYPFRYGANILTLGSRIMAVADIFTATTEDRPYRRGMTIQESVAFLNKMVTGGAIDGNVVDVLTKNIEDILGLMRDAQAAYAAKQLQITSEMAAIGD